MKIKFNMKKYFSSNIREITLFIIIFVISVLVQWITKGVYLSGENIYDLFRESAILAIMSVGMMMVIVTGGIDLSAGSVIGLTGMCSTLILRENKSMPLVVIVLIALSIGCLCGLGNGFIVAKLKIHPMMATLGTAYIYRGFAYWASQGRWVGQGDMTPEFMKIATGNFLGINYLVIIAFVIFAVGYIIMNKFRFGRFIYAIGNSEESARITGINVDKIKIETYMIMGIISGLCGLLWVCKYGNAQAESATGYEMSIIASCVLGGISLAGGIGRVSGIILGALLFGILNNILPLIKVSQFWQQGLRGFIILASIIINALTQRNINNKALIRRKI